MNDIDVSIIIPTYNRLWSLPEAILSCKNTMCKSEIIVIDDGSTDGTWDWLESQKDIICIKQDNWGKCWAVNKGFEIANGKYVRFLDSDDLLNKNALDEQFLLAEKENVDVVVGGYQVIDDQGRFIREQEWIYCDDFIAQQLGECDSSHYSAYLFKREFIKDIPHRPDYAFRDDRLFVLELALKQPKVGIYEGIALKHRQHSKTRLQKQKGIEIKVQNFQHFNIYKKIYLQLMERNLLTDRRIKSISKIMWSLARWVAIYNILEAKEILYWIKKVDNDFEIPENKLFKFLYFLIGFENLERILTLKRILKNK